MYKAIAKCFIIGVVLFSATSLMAKQYTAEDFFKNPKYVQMSVSPNGKYLAALAPLVDENKRRNIAIIDLDDRSKSKFITALDDQNVAGYTWATDDRIVFFVDIDGQEAPVMYSVSRDGGKIKTLIDPFGKDESRAAGGLPAPGILDLLKDDKKHILVSFDKRKIGEPDVYRVNIKTGSMKMVQRNPGKVAGWITDHNGRVIAGMKQDSLMNSVIYRGEGEEEFRELASFRYDAPEAFTPIAVGYDNKTMYVRSNKDHDTAAIYTYNPDTGEFSDVLFHNEEVDAGGMMMSDKHKKVLAYTYLADKPYWVGVDEEFTAFLKQMEDTFPDKQVNISSQDDDENLLVITVSSDTDPGEYYLFDRSAGKLEFLAKRMEWINPDDMSPMKPIKYDSRDGLTIHGYLTVPKSTDGKNLPMIINPHGGPWARDTWGFNPEHQFFAQNGYAVMQMNFRGSTGYGMKHLQAGNREWGRKMQHDITDGVKWAIEQGIADPDRICIYGASYGGYATMAGMTFTPELYKCGVNYVGVTDIALLFKTLPKRWKLQRDQMTTQVGSPDDDEELLAERSPVNHVENIQAPVFIVHGRKDPRVNIEHANKLRKAMEKHDKDYQWMVKNDEGHGFNKEENRVELYTEMIKFFGKYIGDTNTGSGFAGESAP